MNELVSERGRRLVVAKIVGHVHRPVCGFVISGELLLEHFVFRALVVEAGGDEAEQLQREAFVSQRLGRQLARHMRPDVSDEGIAIEEYSRNRPVDLKTSGALDLEEHLRNQKRLSANRRGRSYCCV